MTTLSKEERAALNALALKGQLAAARCVERLLMDGETVLVVTSIGGRARVEILPPSRVSPLWRDAATWRLTEADVGFVAVRFGCEIRWTLTRAEADRLNVADAGRKVH